MGKGSKNRVCKSGSHQLLKDRAKNRVDDLQGMFSDLQSARKDSRSVDVAVLEEQVHQMLREWKSELNQPSPASSLQGGSLGSFSSDICRLLQLCEEEDDATSALAAPKAEPNAHKIGGGVVSYEVLGNAKGAVVVVVSILIFRNPVSVTGMLGYLLTVIGVVLYSEAKKRSK